MFDILTAEEIMKRDLIKLQPSNPVLPAISRMLESNISGAPVVDEQGNYLGVFSEKCSLFALTDLVDRASQEREKLPSAKDFMTKHLVTLTPEWDVFAAIDHILKNRISGAPVVDESQEFVGVFSEKTAMRVLMASIHDSVPSSKVKFFLNLDRNRIIGSGTNLHEVARKFQETPYRRLPVLKDNQLLGQVSRRDVLRAELNFSSFLVGRTESSSGNNANGRVENGNVGEFMDREALTVQPQTDLLGIAQLFLNSTYRRLPVVDKNEKLLGQVSRRDLLEAASSLLKPGKEAYSAATLYLSQVSDEVPSQIR